MITLYDYPMAPSPRRARILLAEKGIPFKTVTVDLAVGEQLSPAFRAINPLCTVPAVALSDGTVLPNNAAIAAWAEAVYPEPALLGHTPIEKAAVASWVSRLEFEGLMAVAEAFRNTHPAMANRALTGEYNVPQIPELGQRGYERAIRFFAALDAHMAQRSFVATEQFTWADITAVVLIDFARVIRFRVDDQHPHLQRYRESLAKRTSLQA